MQTAATQLSAEIRGLGLERFVLELESDGLTIVPPEVTGVTPELLDRCTEVLCQRFEEMTGCPINVEDGPLGELEWPTEAANFFDSRTWSRTRTSRGWLPPADTATRSPRRDRTPRRWGTPTHHTRTAKRRKT